MTYPTEPGFKEGSTSNDAAQSMKASAPKLRTRVRNAISKLGDATADEVAEALDITPFSARPRVTELATLGVIEYTGERRPNISGRSAKVWRLAS